MEYPDEKLTATSKYSHAEICATLDRWREVEAQFDTTINAVDYSALPADILSALDDLEPVVCPMDGIWHRAGNCERFPVAKWKRLIKAHERLTSRLTSVSSQNSD